MNTTPNQPEPNDRAELVRLLPELVDRELPSDRHQRLQEFVMSQIQQDLQAGEQAPRRSPKRRRALVASALTAVGVATAAAAVIGTGGSGSAPVTHATTPLSGRQVLLAAATTAERAPQGSGTYWHVKITDRRNGKPFVSETWTQRGGQTWSRGDKTQGKMEKDAFLQPFSLGGPKVSFEQLQKLPTSPGALKAWIDKSVEHSDVRISSGRPNASDRQELVFDGLMSLVSALPAPPQVRATAFRAIATYPGVKSLGAFRGGQGLQLSSSPRQVTLVIDPATSRVRDTDVLVTPDGGVYTFVEGTATIETEWTNQLPK